MPLVLDYCKRELNDISYNTWIKRIMPIKIEGVKVYLNAESVCYRSMIEYRYAGLLTKAFHEALGYEVELIWLDYVDDVIWDPVRRPKAEMLNSAFAFDQFLAGDSNKFAYAASLAVVENPGSSYNPLFLYGGKGLGKTHLLHAIGHHIFDRNRNANIIYISAEDFTNKFIQAIWNKQTEAFRSKYGKADVLLVYDIQFILGKEHTQQEFLHLYDALMCEPGKQIVITSDRLPKEIPQLAERSRSRLESGLIVEILPPDHELRAAFLRSRKREQNVIFSDDAIDFIAEKVTSNFHDIDKVFTYIADCARLQKKDVSMAFLRSFFHMRPIRPVRLIRLTICKE